MKAKIVFLSTALAVVLAAASGAHADTKIYSRWREIKYQ